MYKIIHGLSNVKFLTFFEYSDERRMRGHSLKLQKHRSCLDLYVSTSSVNELLTYGNTVTAPTLNCFKRHFLNVKLCPSPVESPILPICITCGHVLSSIQIAKYLGITLTDSHGSVSVFNVGIGIRYFCRYFFKSVRHSVSVFQNIAISVRYFGISAGPL